MKITNGCTYQFKKGAEKVQVKVVGWDKVSKMHVVQRQGTTTESRLDMHKLAALNRLAPCRAAIHKKRKTDTANVYLYVCQIGADTYKYGCSSDPNRRLKQIQTCCPGAKMVNTTKIPAKSSANWSKYESDVLHRFAEHAAARSGGAGREVMKLDRAQLNEVVQYTRRVVARA
jgi:hypothetical protein